MRNIADEKTTEQAAMYALGMLSQSEARSFEEGLKDERDGYTEELASFDDVVAALSLSAPERRPPDRVRKRLLLAVAAEAETAEIPVVSPQSFPPPFSSIKIDEGNWDQVADGVFIKTLFVNPTLGSVTALVKLAPGTCLPRHHHQGIEESIVIEGDCRVNGEIFNPGDYRRAMEGTVDSEVTTERGTIFMLMTTRDAKILKS